MAEKAKAPTEVKSNRRLKLSKIPTLLKVGHGSERHYDALLEESLTRTEELQTLLYASHAKAMLVVFQGMDTSGKDGAIKHVMSGVNPQGCKVVSFKVPSDEELSHDFFWRVNRALPARGEIGIFNRSYYEEVLVTRVHPELLGKEGFDQGGVGRKFWEHRYEDIVHHEKYLHRQGCEIVKIFIHISREEQKRRLLARFDDPRKTWKISESDIRERSFWRQYQDAYEQCIENTSSKHCPWYIVPGDDKKAARLMISRILVSRLEEMDLRLPVLSAEQKRKLGALKRELLRDCGAGLGPG
jgi:PPK2 family polyphosphate:nucleotide phosphotransferase